MRTRVSTELLAFAAAAYDYHAEITNPAPDATMKRITRGTLDRARAALPVEDCKYLSELAGR